MLFVCIWCRKDVGWWFDLVGFVVFVVVFERYRVGGRRVRRGVVVVIVWVSWWWFDWFFVWFGERCFFVIVGVIVDVIVVVIDVVVEERVARVITSRGDVFRFVVYFWGRVFDFWWWFWWVIECECVYNWWFLVDEII